jgi:hypothetical protein
MAAQRGKASLHDRQAILDFLELALLAQQRKSWLLRRLGKI